jgi:hypothetical protein
MIRLYCLHPFFPRTRRARNRAQSFILRAIRRRQGEIMAHIGNPDLYDWVIW